MVIANDIIDIFPVQLLEKNNLEGWENRLKKNGINQNKLEINLV